MLRVFATRCLRALPTELWAGTGGDGEGQPTMGEKEWERIMRGLEARDECLRKEVWLPRLVMNMIESLLIRLLGFGGTRRFSCWTRSTLPSPLSA